MAYKRCIPLAGVFAALLLPVFSGRGLAAEDPAAPHTMPTITVTAQKREENVQQIPSSVGVISDQAIEEKNIREVRDLSHMAPNLNIATSGGPATYSYFGIRGRTNNNADIDPTVTVMVDGVPFADFYTMGALPLFDIERVEVLRGPQSTMYGMNSEAGVINIVTKQPGKTLRAALGGNISTSFEDTGGPGWGIRGSLSGPVIEDTLSVGLAFAGSRAASWIDNISGHGPSNYGQADTGAFRLSAVFTPSDIFDARLNFGYSRMEAENGYIALPTSDAAARAIGRDKRKKWRANIDLDEGGHVETTYGDLHMRLKTPVADIISVSALRRATQKYDTDFDLGADISPMFSFPPGSMPGMGLYGAMENDFHSFTQELRAQSPRDDDSPFEWLAGAFYHNFVHDQDARMGFTDNGLKIDQAPFSVTPMMNGTLTGKSFALFGQGTYRLFDKKLGLTVGLRHEWTEREYEDDLYFRDQKVKENDSQFLPKFSLDYRITPENMVYATAAMGWRPGGVSNKVAVQSAGVTKKDLKYDKETSWTWELGTKNEFFGKRLLLNAAVFYSVYSDYQDLFVVSPMEQYLRNVGEARMAGFEVEAQARITDDLTADLAFGYTDARYHKYKDDSGADFDGKKVAFVPDFNGSFAVKYSFLDGFYVRPEVRLTGTTYWDRSNDHKQDPYLTLHARAGYAADNWEVYVYGDNLTNEYAFTMAQNMMVGDAANHMYGSPIRPLEIGVGFNVTF